MATYTWEYGAAGTGLHFTIVYDTALRTFTVSSSEGKFDLNALWWNDGEDDGAGVKLAKNDSSLNMNGSGEDWDGMAKLSNAGLGKEGEDKNSFISEGETAVFTLADFGITGDFDVSNGGTLGVRATSVNGGDSIKLVDNDPVFYDPGQDPTPDHFPDFTTNISHVDFYFDTDGNADNGAEFIVRVNTEGAVSDDLDTWYGNVVDYVNELPGYDDATLLGAAIKGGKNLNDGNVYYYSLDGDTDPEDPVAPGFVAKTTTVVDPGADYGSGNSGFGNLPGFPHLELSTADGLSFA